MKTLDGVPDSGMSASQGHYGAIKYGQARLEVADSMDLDKDKARYEADRANDLKLSREQGLDAAFKYVQSSTS